MNTPSTWKLEETPTNAGMDLRDFGLGDPTSGNPMHMNLDSIKLGSAAVVVPSRVPAVKTILCSGGYDHTVKVWNVNTALCVKTFDHLDSQVNVLSITGDGIHVAAGGYQHVRIYEIQSSSRNPSVTFKGPMENVRAVGFNKNVQWMYTGSEDSKARIWDLRSSRPSPECQKQLDTSPSPITYATLHPNNVELVITDKSGTIHVWDLRIDKARQLHPEQSSSAVTIESIAIDPLGKYVAAVNSKGEYYLWNLSGSTMIAPTVIPSDTEIGPLRLSLHSKMKVHKRYGLKCVFSPDSSLLATTSADETAKIWSVNEEELTLLKELSFPGQLWVWDAAFTSDSRHLFTASSDKLVKLWSVKSGRCEREFTGHERPVTAVALLELQM